MSMARSLASPNLPSPYSHAPFRSRTCISTSRLPPIPASNHKHRLLVRRAIRSSSSDGKGQDPKGNIKIETKPSNLQFHQAAPTKPKVPLWVGAVLGTIFVGLPCWILLSSGGDEMVKKVDLGEAVDIHRAAEMTKKIASELSEKLPNNSDLKKLVSVFEHASEEVHKNAKLIDSFIHKMDEVKGMLETLIGKEKVPETPK